MLVENFIIVGVGIHGYSFYSVCRSILSSGIDSLTSREFGLWKS